MSDINPISVVRQKLDEAIDRYFENIYSEPMPEYVQLELDFLDEMFKKRIEDDKA